MECLQELQRIFDYLITPDNVAAVLMEPVLGEGGYVVPPAKYVKAIRELCTKHGILLIFDEIQSGFGRTGKMFASEHFGVVPDIMTLGKAIAGGLPMSAVVSTKAIMDEWHPGQHGTTFGGHPVCAAAGLAVLKAFEEEHILENVNKQGEYLRGRLLDLQKK
jgi:4-aminobutyrate aminotransferase